MKRRDFLRIGAAAAGAPAVLPLLPEGLAATSFRRGRPDPDGLIRLSSNENPLGLAEGARRAVVDAVEQANRYSGLRSELAARLAAAHGVEPSGIVLGNGSAEAIQMAVQAHWDPQVTLVRASPTYEDASRYSRALGFREVAVPLASDHQHDLGAMDRAARTAAGPILFYVCNPNNPTGTLTSTDDLEAVIDGAPDGVTFLVDEAYFEYVDDPGYRSLDRLAFRRPNVVVFRTFSKVYGMAGLRIGYAVAHPDTAARMQRLASTVNLNLMGQVAAAASLDDPGHVARSLDENRKAREVAVAHLDGLGVEHLPSHTNFLMHRLGTDLDAYRGRMQEAGIRVGRAFPPMDGYNRLSMGTVDEMERWAAVHGDLRRRGLA